jgi:hypothetical protein
MWDKIAIIISVVALLVTGYSACDAHKQVKIAQHQFDLANRSAKEQAADVERSRLAAERSASAAEDSVSLAKTTASSTLVQMTRQATASVEQAAASRQQAEAATSGVAVAKSQMEVANRPWLSLAKIEIASPLKFSSGPEISIKFTVANSGRSPATKVSIASELFPMPERNLVNQHTAANEVEKVCDEAKRNGPFGFNLAKNREWSEVDNLVAVAITSNKPTMTYPHMTFAVVGCINYTFTFGPEDLRQSSFAYELDAVDPPPPADRKFPESLTGIVIQNPTLTQMFRGRERKN